MPRDYKSRANPQSGKSRQVPGPVWFVGGLLVGLFFSGLAWLKLLPPQDTGVTGAEGVERKQKQTAVTSPSQEKKGPPKPRFDFYTILPEMEVVVPEPEPTPKPPTTRTTAEPVVVQDQERVRYMLQMGSFRRYEDADRLKASLALVDIQAEIQRVRIDSGDVFHRVRSGPYGPDKVKQLSDRLKANSISSLVIRLK